MAKPQCLVFILRHKGLKSLKFGSVHWPKSWLCSFSTGLAQNNLAASWPSTFLLYQPGLDPGSISAKLDHSVPQTNQSVRQRVTVQNLHHESKPDWSHSFPPGFVPSFFFFPPPHATCHRFLYIFLTCVPAFGFEPLCKMLPKHLNLSWTATRADVVLLTTLNLCDTKPVLPARWLCTANHYMPFHYTFHYEMSNHPTPFFNQIVHFPVWMHGSFPSDFTHRKVNVYDNIDTFVFQCLDLSVDTLLLYWSCGAAALQIHPSVSCHHLPCTQCVRALESIPAVFGRKWGFCLDSGQVVLGGQVVLM